MIGVGEFVKNHARLNVCPVDKVFWLADFDRVGFVGVVFVVD